MPSLAGTLPGCSFQKFDETVANLLHQKTNETAIETTPRNDCNANLEYPYCVQVEERTRDAYASP
jgi:hypothetical protein